MKKIIILATFCLLIAGMFTPHAYAVFLSPTILMFDNNKNTGRITLNNRSKQIKVITFDWQRLMFSDSGKAILAEEGKIFDGYRPVDPYIKFSPQRVILRPGQRQTIRLIASRPQDMAVGEYRSHFTVKEEKISKSDLANNGSQKGVSGEVVVNVNKSIPIFIRQGETVINWSFEKANIINENGQKFLDFSLLNSSTRSLYGHMHLLCSTDTGTLNYRIAPLRLYVERKKIAKKTSLENVDLSACNSLTAQAIGRNDIEFGGKVLTETPVTL